MARAERAIECALVVKAVFHLSLRSTQGFLESVVQLEDSERQEYVMPICNAVEKVFGSAAAISSAFGVPDAVGLEATLLENIQAKVMSLEPPVRPSSAMSSPNETNYTSRCASA